jgi:hypothetical protein
MRILRAPTRDNDEFAMIFDEIYPGLCRFSSACWADTTSRRKVSCAFITTRRHVFANPDVRHRFRIDFQQIYF